MLNETELSARQYHIHEHDIVFWLVFDERVRFPFLGCQYTLLKHVRTLEHWMFAGDMFADHHGSERVGLLLR